MTLQDCFHNGEKDGRILGKELREMTDNVVRSHNSDTCPCITCCKIRREKEKKEKSTRSA